MKFGVVGDNKRLQCERCPLIGFALLCLERVGNTALF